MVHHGQHRIPVISQESPLPQRDRATHYASRNLANYCTTVETSCTTNAQQIAAVFAKTSATTQRKRKKSCFWILKKNVKNVKKRTYSFRVHLITPAFNTQLPKVSTGRSPTSRILAQKCGRSAHIHKKLCNLELCV